MEVRHCYIAQPHARSLGRRLPNKKILALSLHQPRKIGPSPRSHYCRPPPAAFSLGARSPLLMILVNIVRRLNSLPPCQVLHSSSHREKLEATSCLKKNHV